MSPLQDPTLRVMSSYSPTSLASTHFSGTRPEENLLNSPKLSSDEAT